jgi:hypothetical protein
MVTNLILHSTRATDWYKQLIYFKKLNIPSPIPAPVFGNLFSAIQNPEFLTKYGRVTGFFLGSDPVINCEDANMIKAVLIKDFNSFYNRRVRQK